MNVSIGMKAPDFTATTTFGPMKMSDHKGHWVILFSHPGDFTPVCTTEFIAFSRANDQFEALNAKLIGLSIDSNPSHLAWVNQIYLLTGIQVPFPIIADRTAEVAKLYGMIAPDASKQETVRNVFFIDPDQVIRAILIYPLTNGRNIYEILRLLTALQTTDSCKVVTPANWQPDNPTMIPPPRTYDQLLERVNDPESMDLDCMDWFWCYNDRYREQ
jgi:peroxiredoxin 2/4